MRLADILRIIKKEDFNKMTTPLREKMIEEPKVESIQQEQPTIDVEEIYSQLITTTRKMFQTVEAKNKFDITAFVELIAKIKLLFKENQTQLLYYIEKTTPDTYLISHTANVFILSIFLAIPLKYDDKNINKISIASLLHDLGMLKCLNIVKAKRELTNEEFEIIKKHVEDGINLIKNYIVEIPEDFKRDVIEIVNQIHERLDGSGYPLGTKQITPQARLISVCDIYEALTHRRNYRERFLPYDAMRILVEMSQNKIDKEIVKVFMEKMSLYPLGSYVKLNTGDIAKIILTNLETPTRPVVRIILDKDNNKVGEKIIDLKKNPLYSITEAVDETKLKPKDKKLLLELKTQQWWIKG